MSFLAGSSNHDGYLSKGLVKCLRRRVVLFRRVIQECSMWSHLSLCSNGGVGPSLGTNQVFPTSAQPRNEGRWHTSSNMRLNHTISVSTTATCHVHSCPPR